MSDESTKAEPVPGSARIAYKWDLIALDTNVIVMQILDAARKSARIGQGVELGTLTEEIGQTC